MIKVYSKELFKKTDLSLMLTMTEVKHLSEEKQMFLTNVVIVDICARHILKNCNLTIFTDENNKNHI